VTLLGGELTIDGFSVSSVDQTLRPLKVGEDVILFLSRSDELQSWVPPNGPYAVFRVKQDGTVESPRKTAPQNGKSRTDFVNQLNTEIARLGK
jgi:hypothetical protein